MYSSHVQTDEISKMKQKRRTSVLLKNKHHIINTHREKLQEQFKTESCKGMCVMTDIFFFTI